MPKKSARLSSQDAVLGLSVSLLFGGLLFGGMSEAAPAAAFSALTLLLLALMAAIRPKDSLIRAAKAVTPGAFFYFAFLAYAVFSISPLSGAIAHPLWSAFGLNGPLSIAPFRTIEGMTTSLSQAGFAVLGALCIDDRSDRDKVGKALTALTLALALSGIALLIADLANYQRLHLRLDSANAAATMFGMLTLCAIAAWTRRSKIQRSNATDKDHKLFGLQSLLAAPFALTAAILSVACVILTGSRGGILAGFAGLLIYFALASLSKKKTDAPQGQQTSPMIAFGAIALALVVFGGQLLFTRFENIGESSNIDRYVVIETHTKVFLERPIWGHGLNTFHELNDMHAAPENWRATRPVGAAHNIFVQAFEEGGVIGGGLLCAAFGALIIQALWRSLRGQSGREWAAAAFAAAILALLHGTVDFGLNVPAVSALLCFMLGAFTVGTRKPDHRNA